MVVYPNLAKSTYGCMLPQLNKKFEKERIKPIASQEFS
jgi:hypothetical protein